MTQARPPVVLLPSPLLGPAVWRPVARELRALGWTARVVPRPDRPPQSPADVLDHLLAHLGPDPVALVAHSNAGLYVPALRAGRTVRAAVFTDAAVPPAAGTAPLAPPGLLDQLGVLADDDGVLPPWTRWWPPDDVAALFPDDATRAAVEAEQHRLPLAYFRAHVDVPPDWTAHPAAYLAFGDTYADERRRAATWGWPVRTLAGHHLQPLADPHGVAAAIDGLLRRLLDARGSADARALR